MNRGQPGSMIDAKLEGHRISASRRCPSCGHELDGKLKDMAGLPAGVKFDPTDQELIEHLEVKVKEGGSRAHPLIDEFILTIQGEDGICYTHPEKLPGTYSWGSAILTCLYRHLCDACRSRSANDNLGGCAYLLQVWMWERLPVGWPTRATLQAWPWPLEDSVSRPTVAYLWSSIVAPTGHPRSRYLAYTNKLDVIT